MNFDRILLKIEQKTIYVSVAVIYDSPSIKTTDFVDDYENVFEKSLTKNYIVG